MNSKILLLLTILFVTSQLLAQKTTFVDEIVNNEHCKSCYFVALDVASEVYSGRVVIENGRLFRFLEKKEYYTPDQSKAFVKELLLNKQSISFRNAKLEGPYLNIDNFSEREFRVIKRVEKVDKVAAIGCVAFIQYFFLKEPLSSLTNINDETCYSFITKQNGILKLNRTEIGIVETNAIVDKLFEWEIPTMIDDISGLLVIHQSSLERLSKRK